MQTIAALLTPPGRAAVAVVSIAADQPLVAEQIVDQLFTPHGRLGKSRPFSQRAERSIVYGVWDASQEDLVVVRTSRPQRQASESAAAESNDRQTAQRPQPCLEIHCHGGQVAASAVTDALAEQGVSIVSPQDFANQIQSRWSVESELAICQCETQHTLAHAIRAAKLQPGFLDRVKDSLQQGELPEATIEKGLQWSEFGKHLLEPRSVVLFGKPNVGKSSLINRIVGFQRVIVNPQAGTTRDVVGQKTAIGGWPVILKDTAGIRDASNEIEALGIAKAKTEIESADLKIAICDAAEIDLVDWSATLTFAPDMVVVNKTDLLSADELESQKVTIEQFCQSMDSSTPKVAFVSAGQGSGIDLWIEQLGQQLVPHQPDEDQWFPITAWQRETLQWMQRAIAQRDRQTILSLLSR